MLLAPRPVRTSDSSTARTPVWTDYVPKINGNVVRISLSDWTASGVESVDLTTVSSGLKGFEDGFASGSYAYFMPYHDGSGHHGRVVRVSTSDFTTSGVEYVDLTTVSSDLEGYRGAFTDGTYAYVVPWASGSNYHGRAVRISLSDWTASGVETLNLATVNSNYKGFNGGFTDGTYACIHSGPPTRA